MYLACLVFLKFAQMLPSLFHACPLFLYSLLYLYLYIFVIVFLIVFVCLVFLKFAKMLCPLFMLVLFFCICICICTSYHPQSCPDALPTVSCLSLSWSEETPPTCSDPPLCQHIYKDCKLKSANNSS